MASSKAYFKRLTNFSTIPTRQSSGSVGFDLYSAQNINIPAKGRGTVCTDIAVTPPKGYYAQIYSRSALVAFHGITVEAGTIDIDFNSSGVIVILYNHSSSPFQVKIGSKIAQIVFHTYFIPPDSKPLCTSERGSRGLGEMETAN